MTDNDNDETYPPEQTVHFELTVDVPPTMLDGDESDDAIETMAREILYGAPAFDGLTDDMIGRLDVTAITEGED